MPTVSLGNVCIAAIWEVGEMCRGGERRCLAVSLMHRTLSEDSELHQELQPSLDQAPAVLANISGSDSVFAVV